MKDLNRLYKYIKPYWKRQLAAFVFMFLFSILNTGQFWVFKILIDENFIGRNLASLNYVLLLGFLIFFFKGVCQYGQEYLMSYVGHGVVRDVRNSIYAHLHSLSLSFYNKKRTGDLMSHLLNDMAIIQNTVSILVSDIVRQPLVVTGLLGYIFYLHWELAFLCVVVYPLAIYPIVRYSQKLRRINIKVQEKMSDISALLQEVFSGMPVVKAFSMEDYEINKFKRENRTFFDTVMKTVRITAALPSLMEFAGSVGFGFAIYYGVHEIAKGSLTTGEFISFTAAVISFYRPVKSLTQINNNIQQARAATQRIWTLLDTKPEIIEKPNAIDLQRIKSEIRFESVSFSYGDNESVLQNINLEVKAGETIAFVGPSGAGKTTLVNLLMRFYDPIEGRITIDGVDIRDATVKSLRDQIGIVTQDTILFYDTIRNNITYGKTDADFERVVDAAKKANAHDFIEEFQNKYDTIVGERGVRLSSGQRQRLAIARAILKNPPILILDEATSALDTESERQVQSAIKNLMKDRTTFAIAHRLSTIINADCIVVLDRGRIVACGRHEELIQKCGLYKHLYELGNQKILS